MNKFVAGVCLVFSLYVQINGHGILLEPVGRGSRWRIDQNAIKNEDDAANYCGGFWVNYILNIFWNCNI